MMFMVTECDLRVSLSRCVGERMEITSCDLQFLNRCGVAECDTSQAGVNEI